MVAELLSPRIPTRSILDAFITRHQHLLELERSAEEEQTRLLNSNCSPKLLEQKGLAIGSLGVVGISVGLGGKSLIELNRPLAYHTTQELPPHTIRNGDPVRIEQHVSGQGKTTKTAKKKAPSDDEEAAVEGIVYKVSSERIVVAVDGAKEVELSERLRLLKLASSATFDRMERTLAHLQRMVLPDPALPPPKAHNLPLINSLLTLRQPSWTEDLPQTFDQIEGRDTVEGVKWLGERLNDSQKEAIEFCLKAKDVACIHGPPGTGKTHTLIELIFQLLSRSSGPDSTHPPRILITTPSNLALDNLLLRLHTLSQQAPYSTLLPPGSILRLGHPTRVHRDLVRETLDWRAENGDDGSLVKDVGKEIQGHLSDLGKKRGDRGAVKGKDRGKKWGEVRELRKEYRQREVKVVNNVLLAAKVVLATCHSAGSKQLNNMLFDVCIVDEATQAVEAVCWVPILKSRKLILAGDPQQLPPTVMSRNAKPVKNSVLLADKKEANGAVEAVAKTGAATTTADDGSERKTQEGDAEDKTPNGSADGPIPDGTADEAAPDLTRDDATPQVVDLPIEKTTKPADETSLETTVETDVQDNLQTTKPPDETGPEATAEMDGQSEPAPTDTTTELDEAEDLDLIDRPQLRPPRTLETTLFDRLERLYGDGIKRVLKVQYRMNESIASFPSTTLYSNELISDPSVSTRTLLDLPTIVDPTDDEVKDVLEQPVVFFDTAGCEFFEKNEGDDDGKGKGGGRIGEGSKSNENEADVVVKWAKKLVDAGVPEEEIAIVTPYQAQVSLISSLLHDQYPNMTIGSVDGLQGQEREAIILTLVRSNPAGEVGFLGEYRRLNVAMTRARRQLCVVGDSATVGKGSKYLKGWMDWLESNADVRWAGEEQM